MPAKKNTAKAATVPGYNMQPDPKQARTNLITDAGAFHFTDEFTLHSVKNPIGWILEENVQKTKKKNLTLIISSYGGDVNAAFALIDVIKGSSIPVHTVGLGVIASAGLLTFISGNKGNRIITPNTEILSHQFSAGQYGKQHELLSGIKRFEMIEKKMLNHYKRCTGLQEKLIREYLLPPQDIWLDSKDALKLKLCDEIVNI